MDPMADKILVSSVLISFVGLRLADWLAVAMIIVRELIITSTRFLVLQGSGQVIPANIFGKLKTISQMVAILTVFSVRAFAELSPKTAFFTSENIGLFPILGSILIWISAIFSVLSGVTYIYANRRSIFSSF